MALATRTPNGVACRISALAFHHLTMQVPHAVDIAIARRAENARIERRTPARLRPDLRG